MGKKAGKKDSVSELIVVRHGETTWNAAAILQGQAQSSLNDVGKEQARAVADCLSTWQLPIAAIYTSDLERASVTANFIASKCHVPEVLSMKELRERHLGRLQGLSRKDARRLEPEAFKILESGLEDEPIPGGGESLNELFSRAKTALESIAEKHYGERVVVVTHGGVIRAFHYHATGAPTKGRVLNTSINVFRITSDKVWSLRLWGDVTHLKGSIAATASADQDSP